jgi:hypothetical protein
MVICCICGRPTQGGKFVCHANHMMCLEHMLCGEEDDPARVPIDKRCPACTFEGLTTQDVTWARDALRRFEYDVKVDLTDDYAVEKYVLDNISTRVAFDRWLQKCRKISQPMFPTEEGGP